MEKRLLNNQLTVGMSVNSRNFKRSILLNNQTVLLTSKRKIFNYKSFLFESQCKEIDESSQNIIKMNLSTEKFFQKNSKAYISQLKHDRKKRFFVLNVRVQKTEDNMEDSSHEFSMKNQILNSSVMILDFEKNDQNPLLELFIFREISNCEILYIDLFTSSKERQIIGLTEEYPQRIFSYDFFQKKMIGINSLAKNSNYDFFAVHKEDKYLVLLCSSSHKTIRLHRINDKMKCDEFVLKSAIEHEGVNCPVWFSSSTFILASNKSFVLFFFSINHKLKLEMIQRIEAVAQLPNIHLQNINYIEPFQKGFVCGLDDGQNLIVADDQEGRFKYKMGKEEHNRFIIISSFMFESKLKQIIHADFNSDENKVLFVCSDNSICVIPSKDMINQNSFNLSLVSDFSLKNIFIKSDFNFVTEKSSKKEILDSSIEKNLLMTISKQEHQLKLFNYEKNSLEMQHVFVKEHQEEVISGSIHPSGDTIVVGFNSKTEIFTYTYSELR